MTRTEQANRPSRDAHLRIMIETMLRRGADEAEIAEAVAEAQQPSDPIDQAQLSRTIAESRSYLLN